MVKDEQRWSQRGNHEQSNFSIYLWSIYPPHMKSSGTSFLMKSRLFERWSHIQIRVLNISEDLQMIESNKNNSKYQTWVRNTMKYGNSWSAIHYGPGSIYKFISCPHIPAFVLSSHSSFWNMLARWI
jgi:hypothetical protein